MTRHKRLAVAVVLALAALPAAVALAAKAPIDVHGTTWLLNMTVQLKVQRVGGFKAPDQAVLYIGPNAGQGLADDEFKIHDTTMGDDYTGTWTDPKGKGSLLLDLDIADLEDLLVNNVDDLLNDQFNNVSNVAVDITKIKVKVKLDPNKDKASASMKASFIGSADVDGEHQEGKGSFSVKGKGAQ